MVFVAGGLVAWSSHRQAFVTMSTAESELVAICELATCVKSVEHLVAEIMLQSCARANEVIKVLYSDSQSALAVCRCAAGSWRTRHLRIRGSMIRELLELPNWCAYHVDGKVMLADLGTKALAAERFNMLVDRMRVVRTRYSGPTRVLSASQAKKLIAVLCVAAMVERGEAADADAREPMDYMFLVMCLVAIIAVWESFKQCGAWLIQRWTGGPVKRRAETSLSRSADPDGDADRQEASSPLVSRAIPKPQLRSRSRLTGEMRPPTPPRPTPAAPEPLHEVCDRGAYSFP